MISYVTADEQRAIRSDLEQVERILMGVFSRLKPLSRDDERVTRTECVLASLKRLFWVMTSGPGRLGPAVKRDAILALPASSDSARGAADVIHEVFSPSRKSIQAGAGHSLVCK
jgi:TPP-dependent trihydroxycyclohexane-1,2-dione (THcHDO) dehydratase